MRSAECPRDEIGTGVPWKLDKLNSLQFIGGQKQMKSKQYPYEVYVLRKRVNLSSESSQLYSGEAVNQISTGRQVLKNEA